MCQLCNADAPTTDFPVPLTDYEIRICATCRDQIEGREEIDPNHWRALNDTMWSEDPGVQVMAYRMLHRLRGEGWPQQLLDTLYLPEEIKARAELGVGTGAAAGAIIHKDAHGAVLASGDTVVLIKDLKVKGGGFTAKRGTAVRNIRLVHDNAGQIEGRVETQQIVILTEYVKKK